MTRNHKSKTQVQVELALHLWRQGDDALKDSRPSLALRHYGDVLCIFGALRRQRRALCARLIDLVANLVTVGEGLVAEGCPEEDCGRHLAAAVVLRRLLGAAGVDCAPLAHLARTLEAIGAALRDTQGVPAALKQHQGALALWRAVLAQDPGDWEVREGLARCLGATSGLLCLAGRYAVALEHLEEVREIRRSLLGERCERPGDHVACARVEEALADIFTIQGDTREALAHARSAAGLWLWLNRNHPVNPEWQEALAESLERVGDRLEEQGNLTDACERHVDAWFVWMTLMAQDPDNTGHQSAMACAMDKVASTLRAGGDRGEALAQYDASLWVRRRLVAQDPERPEWQEDLALTLEHIGSLKEALHDVAGALGPFEEAVVIRERLLARDPDHIQWREDLSLVRGRLEALLQEEQRAPLAAG